LDPTIDHFEIRPYKLGGNPAGQAGSFTGYVYPISPTLNEKRYKKRPGQPGSKYLWVWKKPRGLHFYDVDGRLTERVKQADGVLYLAAGEPDVWAYWEAGIHNATCLLQGESDPLPLQLVQELVAMEVKTVRGAPDRDKAGRTWTRNLAEAFSGSPIQLDLRELPYDKDSKADVGKYLQDVGAANFRLQFEGRPSVDVVSFTSNDSSKVPKRQPKPARATTLATGLYDRWCIELVEAAAIRTWNIPAPNGKKFSGRTIHCPHPSHEDRTPSASWNYQTHELKRFGCDHTFKTKEVAELLGVDPYKDYKGRHKRDAGRSPKPVRKRAVEANQPAIKEADVSVRAPESADGENGSSFAPFPTQRVEAPPDGVASLKGGLHVDWIARKIRETEYFAKDRGGALYYYRAGAYRSGGEQLIHDRVKAIATEYDAVELWSTYLQKQVVEYIRVDCPELWSVPLSDVLNLSNGLLDTATCTLKPHTPAYLSTVQLSASYDPDADGSYWEQFCSEVFPDDAYEVGVPWQIAAWLMLPNTSLQKALLLLGSGANGKSRFLGGLARFLGWDNVVRLSLQTIETNRFAAAGLEGKLANICPDLPTQHLAQSVMFKQLTGGDRRISVEQKFKDPYEIEVFSRFVYSANESPITYDNSSGFHRRWIVLPLNRTFSGAQRVSADEIDARLAEPSELSGLLNKALDYLPQVLSSGITETPSMLAAKVEFRRASDPLATFLDETTVNDAQGFTFTDDLRTRFADCAEVEMSPRVFTQTLKRLRPGVKRQQRPRDGKRPWAYVGLRWRA